MNEVAATAIAKLAVQHNAAVRFRMSHSSRPPRSHFGAFSIYGEGGSGMAALALSALLLIQ